MKTKRIAIVVGALLYGLALQSWSADETATPKTPRFAT